MESGDYRGACASFERSLKLDEAVGTLLNLAICHEQLGQLVRAFTELERAAELAAQDGQEARAEAARRLGRSLDQRIPRARVRIAGNPPAGLIVTRDGEAVTVGEPVRVDPGTHRFRATAPRRRPWEQAVTVPTDPITVFVDVPELAPGAPRAGERSRARPIAPDRDRGRTRRLVGLGAATAGALFAGSGLFFGWRARSSYDDSRAHCDNDNVCDPIGEALIDDAYRDASIATTLVVGGAALAIGGAILWFTAPPRDSFRAGATVGTLFVPGASTFGVSLLGRF
jgi:tetratricopeptide (TPR) repeat protein